MRKEVIAITAEGNTRRFLSIREASESLNLSPYTIRSYGKLRDGKIILFLK